MYAIRSYYDLFHHPTDTVTSSRKFLAVVLIATGVGTFLALLASLTEIFIKIRTQEVKEQKPQAGHRIDCLETLRSGYSFIFPLAVRNNLPAKISGATS